MPAFSRSIDVTMDWLDSSSFEIRGTLKDNVHILNARFVMSFPGFVIEQASGEITGMPYPGYCQGAMAAIQGLVGERIGRGFRKRAGEIVGGASSCNHLHTLVTNMAACAFQMNYVAAKQNPKAAQQMKKASEDAALRREMVLGWMPQLRNSCFVFSETADPLFQLTLPKKDDGSTLNFNEE
jgi:DUF2889 family protein